MSRSCHSATSSSAAWALPRSTRARPASCSLRIGLRLCGIALEPFCPDRERLLRLAHLGARQVADLGRQALQAGARERDRPQQLGVPVARHHLRRDVLAREAQPREHARLELRARRRVGSDRARDRPDRRLRKRPLQAQRVAVRLEREARELDAERRRLRVHPVRAARRTASARARAPAPPAPAPARARPARSPRPPRAAAAPAPCPARRRRSARSGSSGPPRPPTRPARRRTPPRRGRSRARARSPPRP